MQDRAEGEKEAKIIEKHCSIFLKNPGARSPVIHYTCKSDIFCNISPLSLSLSSLSLSLFHSAQFGRAKGNRLSVTRMRGALWRAFRSRVLLPKDYTNYPRSHVNLQLEKILKSHTQTHETKVH